ncbi:MAG: DUF3606 domain-containing protein [Alcaligenaceae bacterium]|nr:MAG: DUF3606 domain-containing protein [Alcaligenaceae bacterium]
MADDPKKTGLDRKLIALNEEHEVRSWSESLKCTGEELRAAVKAVGNSAEKVREYLRKKWPAHPLGGRATAIKNAAKSQPARRAALRSVAPSCAQGPTSKKLH